jgi:hypothetical protein
MTISMLHAHVSAACPCPCSMDLNMQNRHGMDMDMVINLKHEYYCFGSVQKKLQDPSCRLLLKAQVLEKNSIDS